MIIKIAGIPRLCNSIFLATLGLSQQHAGHTPSHFPDSRE